MEIINIKNNKKYLEEYCKLCYLEWGNSKKIEINNYVEDKINQILTGDKVISILGLIDNDILLGLVSLFKYDGDERRDLTPWYATMYVKEEYRGLGYSKILNDSLINEAFKLGYKKVYLKTDLVNYYEKFGAVYLEDLDCGEKLYYIDCDNIKCPSCSNKLVEIVYGLPSSELMEQLKQKKVCLGGCIITSKKQQAKYYCYRCGKSFYSDLTEEVK